MVIPFVHYSIVTHHLVVVAICTPRMVAVILLVVTVVEIGTSIVEAIAIVVAVLIGIQGRVVAVDVDIAVVVGNIHNVHMVEIVVEMMSKIHMAFDIIAGIHLVAIVLEIIEVAIDSNRTI
jgi:hypothetical protein